MKKAMKTFADLFKEARQRLAYYVEGAILDFTEQVVARMSAANVSKSELAKKLGVEPSYVTKLLSGSNNYTLETMVKVATALNSEVRISLQPARVETQWIESKLTKPLNAFTHSSKGKAVSDTVWISAKVVQPDATAWSEVFSKPTAGSPRLVAQDLPLFPDTRKVPPQPPKSETAQETGNEALALAA
ncbi:MAG: helix-turn-helix transcriptional regulator [Verrucomicrobia bacterium]|nr:helix-turn-helix transcriptional regulator [Verrucomicrobiota bacterium]